LTCLRACRAIRAPALHEVPAHRRVYQRPERFARAAAQHLVGAIERAVAARGRCAIALSGGHTPRPIYQKLAEPPLTMRVPWQSLDVYFGDERALRPDDPNSNYRMAADALLNHVPIHRACVHRIEAERSDIERAARDYEQLLPERLDVLLLGVGADGHTASLFPGSSALGERRRRVVTVAGPLPFPVRVTITPPVIEAAREVVVLAAGREKAQVIRAALGELGSPEALPIRLALSATWFLTADAAAVWRKGEA
jgi:6-phosphogluconolactonase